MFLHPQEFDNHISTSQHHLLDNTTWHNLQYLPTRHNLDEHKQGKYYLVNFLNNKSKYAPKNLDIPRGIPNSSQNSLNILKKSNRDEILKNLNDLDGIGETQILSLKNFFNKNKNVEITEKLIKN